MTRLIDITGQQFGRLTVLRRAGLGLPVKWLCHCECGATTEVDGKSLRRGLTQSCGCLHREVVSRTNSRANAVTRLPEYQIWRGMKKRCYDPNNKYFRHYGGRGIKVCDRWLRDFKTFFADVGPRPTPEHSIDRYPNNDGDYEPDNVRWATRSEQARTKRKKLTREQVLAIRVDPRIARIIAQEFGISRPLVCSIKRRIDYAYVE